MNQIVLDPQAEGYDPATVLTAALINKVGPEGWEPVEITDEQMDEAGILLAASQLAASGMSPGAIHHLLIEKDPKYRVALDADGALDFEVSWE